jgi:hypothetical protein
MKVQEKKVRPKLNAAQVLVYADDENLLRDNINAMKNRESHPDL